MTPVEIHDTETSLFIGGPVDGNRMPVPDHLQDVFIAERPRFTIKDWLEMEADTPATVKHHRYNREVLSTPNRRWWFFRWEGISLEDAIDQLFFHYQQEKI